jgi:3-dehydroquinate synthase
MYQQLAQVARIRYEDIISFQHNRDPALLCYSGLDGITLWLPVLTIPANPTICNQTVGKVHEIMRSIHLPLQDRSYDISIGNALLSHSGEILERLGISSPLILISSNRILELHGAPLVRSLQLSGFKTENIIVPEGELHKHLATVEGIYKDLVRLRANRKTTLVAFGGGVIVDMTGFAAATFLRGIEYIQIPTTFLSQIDSSIGGKTGVNLEEGKNLVGAFWQPKTVIIDPLLLLTLPQREFFSGLFEAIKYGIIQSRTLFDLIVAKHSGIPHQDPVSLETIIGECVRIKADVVCQDEREGRLRMILNFGHTLGHALEAATGYRYLTHGEAIGHGMIIASQLAFRLGKLAEAAAAEIECIITQLAPLPPLHALSLEQIIQPMRSDKKFSSQKFRFVLPLDIGRVAVFDDTPPPALEATVLAYLDRQRRQQSEIPK